VRRRPVLTQPQTPEEEDGASEDVAGSEDESDGESVLFGPRVLCAYFFCFSLESDDAFVNYDSDYEIQDDSPNAQIDIDPYAGVPNPDAWEWRRSLKVHSCQASSFPRTGARK